MLLNGTLEILLNLRERREIVAALAPVMLRQGWTVGAIESWFRVRLIMIRHHDYMDIVRSIDLNQPQQEGGDNVPLNVLYWLKLLEIGCPAYIYHATDDGKIKVYSRLGLGCIRVLEDEEECSYFWHTRRRDT